MSERKLFNKGIAIYKKDFFLVQKLVSWGYISGAREGQELSWILGGGGSRGYPQTLLRQYNLRANVLTHTVRNWAFLSPVLAQGWHGHAV